MPSSRNKNQELGHRMAAASLGVRSEERHAIAIEIEVSGIDPSGNPFHERTYTKDIGQWGCAFLLSVKLRVDDIVSLRVIRSSGEESPIQQSLFQVLRVTPEAERWLFGTWKMGAEDLWNTELEKLGERECQEEGAERRGEGQRRNTDS